MKLPRRSSLLVLIVLFAWGLGPLLAVPGTEAATQKGKQGAETAETVTLKGVVLNHIHTGEKDPVVFMYALDGPPPIKSEFEKIMADYYPEQGLDGDAARALLDQLTVRLKYCVDGPMAEQLMKEATYNARQ